MAFIEEFFLLRLQDHKKVEKSLILHLLFSGASLPIYYYIFILYYLPLTVKGNL
jgi:hypothetical protein